MTHTKEQLKKARKVWSYLEDIPVNDNDEIEVVFMNFEKGTAKLEIWHWIEDTYQVSIAIDLMNN